MKQKDLDAMLDELLKDRTPEEILGESGLVKELTKRLVERALDDVVDGFTLAIRVQRLTVEQALHDFGTVRHVDAEALPSEFFGVDEVMDIDSFVAFSLEMMKVDQQQREGRQSLLAIHDEPPTALVADDY